MSSTGLLAITSTPPAPIVGAGARAAASPWRFFSQRSIHETSRRLSCSPASRTYAARTLLATLLINAPENPAKVGDVTRQVSSSARLRVLFRVNTIRMTDKIIPSISSSSVLLGELGLGPFTRHQGSGANGLTGGQDFCLPRAVGGCGARLATMEFRGETSTLAETASQSA